MKQTNKKGMKTYKTNQKHLEIFKKNYKKYQDLFELNNYNVYFTHKYFKDKFALSYYKAMAHVVTVALSTDWYEREPNEKELEKCALHEVCHLLIYKISNLAECRYVTEIENYEADEETTIKLQNIFLKLIKGV